MCYYDNPMPIFHCRHLTLSHNGHILLKCLHNTINKYFYSCVTWRKLENLFVSKNTMHVMWSNRPFVKNLDNNTRTEFTLLK